MFQNAAKPRGRPRSFDEGDALEKATQVFWSKGYDGVTIDDLVAGMGVGRPSLYAVFGDKRAIFLRVLKAYAERKGASAAKALLSPQGLRDSITGFLRYAVESATEKGSARGCLLICVAPLVDDAEVRQFLQNAAAGGAALVEGRFRDAISPIFLWPYAQASSWILLVALPCARKLARRARRFSGMPRSRPTCCSSRGREMRRQSVDAGCRKVGA